MIVKYQYSIEKYHLVCTDESNFDRTLFLENSNLGVREKY